MMYEHWMMLRIFLVWENKSLTAVGEYWEAESFIFAGDDEWKWFAGDFLFPFENILSGIFNSCLRMTLWGKDALSEDFTDVEK